MKITKADLDESFEDDDEQEELDDPRLTPQQKKELGYE